MNIDIDLHFTAVTSLWGESVRQRFVEELPPGHDHVNLRK